MPNSTAAQSIARPDASVVPWEAETWPIIEHDPERIPVVPPDLAKRTVVWKPKETP